MQEALSSDISCHEPDVQEEITGYYEQEQLQEMLGIGVSYDPRSERELMANIFAAELLMPLERVRLPLPQSTHLNSRTRQHVRRLAIRHAQPPRRLGPGTLRDPMYRALFTLTPSSAPFMPAQPQQKTLRPVPTGGYRGANTCTDRRGPGSGKTSTLIGRVDYLLHMLDVEPGHILALHSRVKLPGRCKSGWNRSLLKRTWQKHRGCKSHKEHSDQPSAPFMHSARNYCAPMANLSGCAQILA